jgi:hypothetical protein
MPRFLKFNPMRESRPDPRARIPSRTHNRRESLPAWPAETRQTVRMCNIVTASRLDPARNPLLPTRQDRSRPRRKTASHPSRSRARRLISNYLKNNNVRQDEGARPFRNMGTCVTQVPRLATGPPPEQRDATNLSKMRHDFPRLFLQDAEQRGNESECVTCRY